MRAKINRIIGISARFIEGTSVKVLLILFAIVWIIIILWLFRYEVHPVTTKEVAYVYKLNRLTGEYEVIMLRGKKFFPVEKERIHLSIEKIE